MARINHDWFFVLIVVIVIIVGVALVLLSDAGVTGDSAKWNVFKYKGCQYLSHDKYGECQITVRQEGNKCDDKDGTLLPEVAQYKRLWDRRDTGWFYRPCSNVRYN